MYMYISTWTTHLHEEGLCLVQDVLQLNEVKKVSLQSLFVGVDLFHFSLKHLKLGLQINHVYTKRECSTTVQKVYCSRERERGEEGRRGQGEGSREKERERERQRQRKRGGGRGRREREKEEGEGKRGGDRERVRVRDYMYMYLEDLEPQRCRTDVARCQPSPVH